MTNVPARTVACPTCGALSEYAPTNRWRPFCSERCKLIDLGAWGREEHTLPAPPDERDLERE